ncbi:MAG: nucleotide sugar dehydrogenase [Pseudomonadota bacterium]|nr:nucleotide sugar dehydrogenase [Pseudomonadota bacterium]
MITTSLRRTNAPVDFPALLENIGSGKATIAIMGIGYVGFPLALATHAQGYNVIAYDVDEEKVAKLNAGKSYLRGIGDDKIEKMLSAGRFHATADASALKNADAIVICVPTPLTKNREPDLRFVEATVATIASQLRPGQLIVLESTTYPGTTVERVKPMLEETGLRCGEDFFLAFSPEREDPGNGFFSTYSIPKIVGADDKKSRTLALALYGRVVFSAVPVSSTAAAEATKLVENIFRSVNIALVNEIKMVFTAMGIDVWEVIEAAKTKPFGFMPFYPGPGVGGHCIPVDPFYLTWKSREYGMPTHFIELAGQINASMPDYVISRLREAMDKRLRKGLNGSRILLLGLAYKKDVDDLRESPSLVIYEKLKEAGAAVDYHDPFIPSIPHTREHDHLAGTASVALSAKSLRGYDAVAIATGHSGVDYALVCKHAGLIIDTRNVMVQFGAQPHVVQA